MAYDRSLSSKWKFHIVSYKHHKHGCFSTQNFEEKVTLSTAEKIIGIWKKYETLSAHNIKILARSLKCNNKPPLHNSNITYHNDGFVLIQFREFWRGFQFGLWHISSCWPFFSGSSFWWSWGHYLGFCWLNQSFNEQEHNVSFQLST